MRMLPRRSTAVLTSFTGALVLAACSPGSADRSAAQATGAPEAAGAPGATPRDPCELITAEDARRVLGTDVTRTDPLNLGQVPTCQYMARSAESVTLQVHPGGRSDFDSYVTQSVDAFGATSRPVTGVGERAAMVGEQFVFASKGRLYILLIGKRLTDSARAEHTRQLAAAVLGRA
jgi:hypothetical protein